MVWRRKPAWLNVGVMMETQGFMSARAVADNGTTTVAGAARGADISPEPQSPAHDDGLGGGTWAPRTNWSSSASGDHRTGLSLGRGNRSPSQPRESLGGPHSSDQDGAGLGVACSVTQSEVDGCVRVVMIPAPFEKEQATNTT